MDMQHPVPKRSGGKPTKTIDALPPHSMETEAAVISCVLQSPELSLSHCQESGCSSSWFYELRHKYIWDAIWGMQHANVPVDLISLQQWLKDARHLDAIGGIPYLSELQDKAPSAANLSHYVELLREKWLRRQMLATSAKIATAVSDTTISTEQIVAEAAENISALSETQSGQPEQLVTSILPAVLSDLENYHRGDAQIRGLSTGLAYVDKMLCGIGGEDNNMVVLAGRPGTGKTSLALDVVLHVALDHPRHGHSDSAEKGLPVAIFSLEMGKKALVKRMVFQRAQADAQRWRTGYGEGSDIQRISQAGVEIGNAPIVIDDTARCTIDEIKARARRMHRQYGIRLFVVDYIQLISSQRRRFRDDRVQELAEISGELQKLGKELQTPFIILAQMNRDYEKEPNREPRLSDLKDCGAIEQDADVVAFLHSPKKAEDEESYVSAMAAKYGEDWSKFPKRVDLLIAKSRNGPTGPCQLLFQKSSMHFFDWYEWRKEHGFAP